MFCVQWQDNIRATILTTIRSAIAVYLNDTCTCQFTESSILSSSVHCQLENPSQAIYRAVINGNENFSSLQLTEELAQWIQQSPSVSSGIHDVQFDSSCPVMIVSFDDPLCAVIQSEPPSSIVSLPVIGFVTGGSVLVLLGMCTVVGAVLWWAKRRSRCILLYL